MTDGSKLRWDEDDVTYVGAALWAARTGTVFGAGGYEIRANSIAFFTVISSAARNPPNYRCRNGTCFVYACHVADSSLRLRMTEEL